MKLRLAVLSAIALSSLSLSVYAAETTTSSTAPSTSMAAASATPAPFTLNNNTDKVSYAIGVDIGRNFKSQHLVLNPEALQEGVKDGLSGGTLLMSAQDMQTTLTNFQKDLIAQHEAQTQQIGGKNKADGDAYLAANKDKPGVVTLPDGLQYKVIKAGEGNSPTANDLVTVNYTGTFIDGKIFDSSYSRGKPVTFPVSGVIPGWTEALKMMKPGAVWELAIPSALAYGDKGAGPIGPNQVLLFKVELIAVNPANAK